MRALLPNNVTGDFSLTWATGPTGPQPNQTLSSATTPAEPQGGAIGNTPAPTLHPSSAIYAKSALGTTDDVVSFGIGLGADALHGTLQSTAIFEIIRDNL